MSVGSFYYISFAERFWHIDVVMEKLTKTNFEHNVHFYQQQLLQDCFGKG